MRVKHHRSFSFNEDEYIVDLSWTHDDWIEDSNITVDVDNIRMKVDYILSYIIFVMKKVTSRYQEIADELGVKLNVDVFHNIVKVTEKIINSGEKPDDWLNIYLTTSYDDDSNMVMEIRLRKSREYWEIFNYKLKNLFSSLSGDYVVLTPGGSPFKQ